MPMEWPHRLLRQPHAVMEQTKAAADFLATRRLASSKPPA